jgi:hypothetical protein
MPTIHDLKKSKYLKKEDFPQPALLTIRGYEEVNVAMEGAEPELRWALTFNELEKPMVLNSTNGNIIASFLGSESFDEWIGKKIVLYADPNISFGGKLVGGIRARAPRIPAAPVAKKAKAAPAPMPTPPPEPEPESSQEDDSVPF